MDKPMFWTVFKADMLFTICSVTVSVLITMAIAIWRKKKKSNASLLQKPDGPRAILLGGTAPNPGHCPLCGQGWPLPGPVVPAPLPPITPPTL